IIDVKDIIGYIIVSNVNIRPAVVVQISNADTQSIAFNKYSCFNSNIGESSVAVVSVKAIVVKRGSIKDTWAIITGDLITLQVSQHIQVKITILIIIEERCVLTIPRISNTVLDSFIFKYGNTLIIKTLMNEQ